MLPSMRRFIEGHGILPTLVSPPPGPFLRRTPPHPREGGGERVPAQPAAGCQPAAFVQPLDPPHHAANNCFPAFLPTEVKMGKWKVGNWFSNGFCDFAGIVWAPEGKDDGDDCVFLGNISAHSFPLLLCQSNFRIQPCLLLTMHLIIVAKICF